MSIRHSSSNRRVAVLAGLALIFSSVACFSGSDAADELITEEAQSETAAALTLNAPNAWAMQTQQAVDAAAAQEQLAATLGPLPDYLKGWLCESPSPNNGNQAVCIKQQNDGTYDAVTCGTSNVAPDQSAELTSFVANAQQQEGGQWQASFGFNLGSASLASGDWSSSSDAQAGTILWSSTAGEQVKITLPPGASIPDLTLVAGDNYLFARLTKTFANALDAANAADALLSGATVNSQIGTTCDSMSIP
jgi:hypothetical protein